MPHSTLPTYLPGSTTSVPQTFLVTTLHATPMQSPPTSELFSVSDWNSSHDPATPLVRSSKNPLLKFVKTSSINASTKDPMTPMTPTYMHPVTDLPPNIWFPLNSRTGSIRLRLPYAISTARDAHRQTFYHTNGTAWIHSVCAPIYS